MIRDQPATIARPAPGIPRTIKRNTILLAATQAFVGTGNQLVPALGPLMIVQLLGSATLAGLGTSMLNAAKFLISYPIGWVADTVGRRAALMVGLVLCLVGTLVIGASMAWSSFPLLVVGMLVFGLGVGAGQQLRLAAADLYPPSRRAEGLGWVLSGSLIGALGGPLLVSSAEAMSGQVGLPSTSFAWLLVPIVLVPSMVLVFFVRPDPKEIAENLALYYPDEPIPEPPIGGDAAGAGFRVWLSSFPLRVAFLTSFAAQGTMSLIMAMTALALSHHGHGLEAISTAVAIHVVGMYGLSVPLGRLTDRLGRRNMMLLGACVEAIGAMLVPASPEYWVITSGTFLVGLGWSCINVSVSALIADLVDPLDRGRAIGANDTFSGAGAIVMPLAGGPLVELWSLSAVGVVGAVLMLAAVVLLSRLPSHEDGGRTVAVLDAPIGDSQAL